jgi:allophanate hydrolase
MIAAMTIETLLDDYRQGRRTPAETVGDVLASIAAYPDPAVWIGIFPPDILLARAAALQADPSAMALPLYGIPFSVKDNIDALGLPTTAGCPDFAYAPDKNATVVQRLLDAGAILIGKTNLDQFATGLVGTRSPHGAPRCVFDDAYISGGSSSGASVSVAAGLVVFALGTDTAGSGRVPAGFNNIVGLKPTKGLVSSAGMVPACRSLDCVSIFSRTVADAITVLRVLEGTDEADAYSRGSIPCRLNIEKFRFGVLAPQDRVFCEDAEAEALYDAAIENAVERGGTPVMIDFAPFREAASLLYDGPFVAERLAAIEPFFETHAESFDPIVRQIVAGAKNKSAADAYRGLYRLAELARVAAQAWQGIDILLLPTSPTIFRVSEVMADPVRLNSVLGTYTNFVNLLDYAAIAIPAGFRVNGLPAGVTLIGPAFSDHDLAVLASRLHEAASCGYGRTRDAAVRAMATSPPAGSVILAVAGAHLSGLVLNHQLLELGATLSETASTAADYRLLALPGTSPPKPGLVRTPGFAGPGIEVELWRMDEAALGRFVASLPPPMGIGKVVLADGRVLPGFLCEACALEGAEDITRYGGWRNYLKKDLLF